MQSLLKVSYGFLLFTLLFAGVELFVWFYLSDIGYLGDLIRNDQSHVSLLIMVIYALASLWFLYASSITSRQFSDINRVGGFGAPSRQKSLQYFYQQMQQSTPNYQQQMAQLDVLDTRLRSVYAFGFIVADLMLKLGILGTVIGFIIMLGSLSNLNSVDITVMQTLLAEMSNGMRVALYTTLSGMLAGIILNIKYNLLDWAVDHLVNDIKEQLSLPATDQ